MPCRLLFNAKEQRGNWAISPCWIIAAICVATIHVPRYSQAQAPEVFDQDAFAVSDGEPPGAEDASAEDDRPRIPEPMVFDLVRPLGALRGEFEFNTLALIPIGNPPDSDIPNALGLTDDKTEWAPEFEYAVLDGLAFELELPFETTTLASYKGAGQWTFGTAFGNRYIHGVQAILQFDRHPVSWLPTVLYVAGFELNPTWSVFGMLGVRGDTGAEVRSDRVQRIVNLSLFRHLTDLATFGVESNLAVAASGNSSLLVIPQLHFEITDYFMIQAGAGGIFTNEGSAGQGGVRVIRSF